MTTDPLEQPRHTGPTLPAGRVGRIRPSDIGLAAIGFVALAFGTWVASGMLDHRLLTPDTVDLWFEADISRVVENMSQRWSPQHRATVHPAFTLFTLPVVTVLQRAFSLDPWVAIRVVLAVAAGLWAVGVYAVLRLMGCRQLDAGAFTLLGATSACGMFWFAVPETHTLASLTILLAFLVVALSAWRRIPVFVEVAVGAATLGVTVTNWMAGILASWSHRPWRQALQISVNAFALTVLLWAAGKKLTPSAPFFLGNAAEGGHILAPEALGPVRVATSFFVHTMVMPAIGVMDRPGAGDWPVMLVQGSFPGSAGPLSLLSVVLWLLVLGLGISSLWRVRSHMPMRLFVVTFLAGQLVLHLLFGNETFLYAPNFLPGLVVLAAFGALGSHRRLVIPVVLVLIVANIANNGTQWLRASRFLTEHERYHHAVEAARMARADDPWPDEAAFRRLPMAATRNFDVGYVSGGGSFSPGIDQFTISAWARGENGIVFNSDTVRSDSGGAQTDSAPPVASTSFYEVRWEPDGIRRYRAELSVHDGADVELVVRSVGANPAPIRRITWNGSRLTLNSRWVIEVDSPAIAAHLVDENVPGWENRTDTGREIAVENGWAAARLALPPGNYSLVVHDLRPDESIDKPLDVIPPVNRVSKGFVR